VPNYALARSALICRDRHPLDPDANPICECLARASDCFTPTFTVIAGRRDRHHPHDRNPPSRGPLALSSWIVSD